MVSLLIVTRVHLFYRFQIEFLLVQIGSIKLNKLNYLLQFEFNNLSSDYC